MSKEKDIKIKEEVENLLDLFSEYRAYCRGFKIKHDEENNPSMDASLREKLEEVVKKIIMLEIEGTMYSVNEEKEPISRKDLKIKMIENVKDSKAGSIDYEDILNENGEVIDKSPTIVINLGRITAAIEGVADKEGMIDVCKDKTIRNIFHEVQHLRQDEMSIKKESSKNSLLFAKESVICSKDNALYKENYGLFAIEKDANAVSYSRCMEIMGESEKWKTQKEKEKECFFSCKYNTLKKDEQGNSIYKERNEAITESLDKIMQNKEDREEAFRLYPIIEKEYNKDGTKKKALDLVTNMVTELIENKDSKERDKEIKGMYLDLIYNRIQEDNKQLEEIFDTLGKERGMKLLNGMQDFFEEENVENYEDSRTDNLKRIISNKLDEKNEDMDR